MYGTNVLYTSHQDITWRLAVQRSRFSSREVTGLCGTELLPTQSHHLSWGTYPYRLPRRMRPISPARPHIHISPALALPPHPPAHPTSHSSCPSSNLPPVPHPTYPTPPAPSVSSSPVGPGRHAAERGGRPEAAVGPAPRAAGIARLLTRAQLQRVLEGAEHAGRQPPVQLLQELLGPVRAAPRRPPAAPQGARPARRQHQRQQHAGGQRPDLRDRPLRAASAPEDGRRAHRPPRAPRPCPAPRAPRAAPAPAPRPSRPSRPTSSRTPSLQRGHVRRARVRVPAGLLRRGLRVPVSQRSPRHRHLSPAARARGPYPDFARAGSRWLLLDVRRAGPRDEPGMGSLPPVARTHQCPHVPGDAVGIRTPSRVGTAGRDWAGARGGAVAGDGAAPAAVCAAQRGQPRLSGGRTVLRPKRCLQGQAHRDHSRPPGESEPNSLDSGFSSAG